MNTTALLVRSLIRLHERDILVTKLLETATEEERPMLERMLASDHEEAAAIWEVLEK